MKMSTRLVTIKTFDSWPSLMLDKQLLERNGIHAFSQDEYLANSSLPPALEGYRLQVNETDLPAARALLGQADVLIVPETTQRSGSTWFVYLAAGFVLIFGIVAFVNGFKSLSGHFVNLLRIDKDLHIYKLVISGLMSMGCIAMLVRQKWAWYLVTTLVAGEAVRMLSDSAARDYAINASDTVLSKEMPLGYRFAGIVISLIISAIFHLPVITAFFKIGTWKHSLVGTAIVGVLCAIPFFLPVTDDKTISSLYIEFKEEGPHRDVRYYYRGKPYTGSLTDRYSDSIPSWVIEVRNGWPEGEGRSYFPDGKLRSVYHMAGGKMEGEYKEWHPNGNLMRVFNHRDGVEHGVFYEYAEDGSKAVEKYYVKGSLHGPYMMKSDGGLREEQGYYRNNEPDSLWITWVEGVKFKEQNFKNGMKHGKTLYWHQDGSLSEEQYYLNDKETGTWTEWDKDGNVISVEVYRDGVQVE